MKPLASEELRLRVRIEAETRGPNGRGGFTTAWTPLVAVWAKKVPLRGDEITRESIVRSVSTARFIIRYRADVSPLHRIVELRSGRIWNIRSSDDPYGNRDRLELTAETGVPT
ncbi:MAG: phage head closure protein [Sphingobium sp.]|uniref:phage head closure protein n=1 Tax=Sphingobium sp. TaxID=1912891 RepID=UPI0029A3493F|nr:phage head closure protein [Sphingobium sp.]MDX3908419.1 phage head closure protein [Sphingobium sp.]